jgi:SNF2 family DNA or RNA helicase
MRMKNECTICNKTLVAISECKLSETQKIVSYKCGHSFIQEFEQKHPLHLQNITGTKKARHYQEAGVDFIVNGAPGNEGGFNCTLGDQMRIGKTPQFLMAIASAPEKRPVLCILRATNARQWLREYKDWVSALPLGVYLIEGSKNWIPPGFDFYIISMDTFSSEGTCKNCKHGLNRHDEDRNNQCSGRNCRCRNPESAGDAMTDRLLEFGFKVCVVDEAHAFKNTASKRSKALSAFLMEINRADIEQDVKFNCPMCKHMWDEKVTIKVNSSELTQRTSKKSECPNCAAAVYQSSAINVKITRKCGVVFLTGTAIKNRADELFTPLNIMAPEKFPSLERYRRNWLIQDDKGKWSRVNPRLYDQFKREIAPYYLRREKQDVYTDLPPMNRMFTVITIEDGRYKDAYNKVLDKMEHEMATRTNYSYFDSIGDLMILRQICGLAKVKWVSDYVETMVFDSDNAKVAIGVHHHSVRDALKLELAQWGVVKIDGNDAPETKDRIAHKYFETSPERVMILGMQAAKEGLELLYIPKALVVEREFTAADEEQFEYRFYNPDKELLAQRGYPNKVTEIEYILAEKTTDQFFHEMVEEKRAIFGETLGTNWDPKTDTKAWRELLEKTVNSRL